MDLQNGLRHFDFVQHFQYRHGRVRCVPKRYRPGSRDRARLNGHFGGHACRLGGHAGNAGAWLSVGAVAAIPAHSCDHVGDQYCDLRHRLG